MTLDQQTLLFVADIMMARAQAERIMRDDARREGREDMATMHGDRAQAFTEAAAVIPSLADQEIEVEARKYYEASRTRVGGRPAWERLDPRDAYDMGMRARAIEQAKQALTSNA